MPIKSLCNRFGRFFLPLAPFLRKYISSLHFPFNQPASSQKLRQERKKRNFAKFCLGSLLYYKEGTGVDFYEHSQGVRNSQQQQLSRLKRVKYFRWREQCHLDPTAKFRTKSSKVMENFRFATFAKEVFLFITLWAKLFLFAVRSQRLLYLHLKYFTHMTDRWFVLDNEMISDITD